MLPDSLQPYAKAAYPALLTLAAVLAQLIVTGEIDRAEVTTALTGLLGAAVTLLVPNAPATHVHEGNPVDDDGKTTLGTEITEEES